jgi:predicted NUDIX family NTP pyrophosphohydrolase
MAKQSAGLLAYRHRNGRLEVLLAHPGGPFWARRDAGAWTIPKGEIEPGEAPIDAARREFEEEVGVRVAPDALRALPPVRQAGGKVVHAWAVEADVDPTALASHVVTIEWPPRSGRQQTFPEIDRIEWFAIDRAREKVLAGQRPLIEQLAAW